MKNIFPLLVLSLMIAGCNMNPNKEARIQQLESQLEQTLIKIDQIENKIESLENSSKENKFKIEKLEQE